MSLTTFVILASTLLLGTSQAGVIGGYGGSHSRADLESHDFSEGLVGSASSHHESLGSLGDHLDESHFPSDFDESHKGDEYAEGSEHIEHIAESYPEHQVDLHQQYGHESLHHDIHSSLHDFDTKPVPGIDHGKGALSYSTTYEFPEDKH